MIFKRATLFYSRFKRSAEVVLVLLTLPLTAPLALLTALAIILDSKGGAFFVQARPGKHGKVFRMVKFRTMSVLPSRPFRLTEHRDTRLTRVGKWIRNAHLDEIPQLIHVMAGTMRLIGPRPVPLELYDGFKEKIAGYDARHALAPGITGLAQVCLGYVNTLEGEQEKWRYDVYYIAQEGPMLDAWVLWATVAKTLGIKTRAAQMAARVDAFHANKNAP